MSRRSQASVGKKKKGCTVSGCFIAGIFLSTAVFLCGLYYAVEIAAVLQHPDAGAALIRNNRSPSSLAARGKAEDRPGSLRTSQDRDPLNAGLDRTGAGVDVKVEVEVAPKKPTQPPVEDHKAVSTLPSKEQKQPPKGNKGSNGKDSADRKGIDNSKGKESKGGNSKSKKKRKPKDPYNFVASIDPNWGMAGEWDLPFVQVLPTKKILIKRDRRIVFHNFTAIAKPPRTGLPSGVLGRPRELNKADLVLQQHPLYLLRHGGGAGAGGRGDFPTLEEAVTFVFNSSCRAQQQPIYLTLATVGDELYWQLIENFVYTLVKFGISHCALVICVSDLRCMKMCDQAHFPCYNYVSSERPLPSVMEQIAQVKLLHVPKALSSGVDVFMLDLDVGFLEDPRYMIEAFVKTPVVDILVQEDYIFIMNRSTAGWKQWFTEPLPNIGLFLCRGNNKTARVFELAWQKYLRMDSQYEKSLPGKDQNHVLDSMRIGRANFGLKYAYFSADTAPLLDKLVLKRGGAMELGGEAVAAQLDSQKAIALHTTCYEKSTKVMGLKAGNAFWNPRYYDPLRPTITKQLLYLSGNQLLDEVRSLVWLAISTQRSLVLPNILGPESSTGFHWGGQVMWPGFRVTFLKRAKGKNELNVQMLEPAYYWRLQRDYDPAPQPTVLYFRPDDSLLDIRDRLPTHSDAPRVVLHADARVTPAARAQSEQELFLWANHSVGLFPRPYAQMKRGYGLVPSVKGIRGLVGVGAGAALVEKVLQSMRNCENVFGESMGNRSCFQICD